MPRKPRMATLWEVSDPLWERIAPVIDRAEGPQATGRPRADRRRALDGIIFHLRTGCPWNHIPRAFGDDSTIHRYYRSWLKRGIFAQIWSLLLEECRELEHAVREAAQPDMERALARWSRVPRRGRPATKTARVDRPALAPVGS